MTTRQQHHQTVVRVLFETNRTIAAKSNILMIPIQVAVQLAVSSAFADQLFSSLVGVTLVLGGFASVGFIAVSLLLISLVIGATFDRVYKKTFAIFNMRQFGYESIRMCAWLEPNRSGTVYLVDKLRHGYFHVCLTYQLTSCIHWGHQRRALLK